MHHIHPYTCPTHKNMLAFVHPKVYLLVFALQMMMCMADVCKFTYIRRQTQANIIRRSASCYWSDKNAAECASMADSLYRTLGRPQVPPIQCEYTDDVDLFGNYFTEFGTFNSACAKLGGSRAPSFTSDSKCRDPDLLPFAFGEPYAVKGGTSNKFWHSYLGNKTIERPDPKLLDPQPTDPKIIINELVGTDVKSTIFFYPAHDASPINRIYKGTSLLVSLQEYSFWYRGARDGISVVDHEFLVGSRPSIIQIEVVAGGAYIFKVAMDGEEQEWGYMQDMDDGTFALGDDKEAAAKWFNE